MPGRPNDGRWVKRAEVNFLGSQLGECKGGTQLSKGGQLIEGYHHGLRFPFGLRLSRKHSRQRLSPLITTPPPAASSRDHGSLWVEKGCAGRGDGREEPPLPPSSLLFKEISPVKKNTTPPPSISPEVRLKMVKRADHEGGIYKEKMS